MCERFFNVVFLVGMGSVYLGAALPALSEHDLGKRLLDLDAAGEKEVREV
jgi:hypothetical protein